MSILRILRMATFVPGPCPADRGLMNLEGSVTQFQYFSSIDDPGKEHR